MNDWASRLNSFSSETNTLLDLIDDTNDARLRKGVDLWELIASSELEENQDFIEARDYIIKLAFSPNFLHNDLEQVLYVMVTHILYYQIRKEDRLNAHVRDISKTANTVKSLCQFALWERKRG